MTPRVLISCALLPCTIAAGSLFGAPSAPPVRSAAPAAAPASWFDPGDCQGDDDEIPFSVARIYWEYNASANDLGVHVALDAEDWKRLRIEGPDEHTLFEVKGKGPYRQYGMTELFFEGAEPSLDEVPLQTLLDKFPEGAYTFEGRTVANEELESTWQFSHAVPAGPVVSATVSGMSGLTIAWQPVTSVPPGFPDRPLVITGYQVIVESFQVTLPPSATSVTVPPEFVGSLAAGAHAYEVLAIEQSGNQTLTEGSFVK